MKTATACARNYRTHHSIPFPNAATPRQVLHKFVDIALVAASGAGLGALLLLLLTMA